MSADESRTLIGGFRVLKDLKAGAGSQGTVYQAVCQVPRFPSVAVGDVVALKVMAVQDDDGKAYARLERRTAELVSLEHPNVVKYHGCFCEKGPFNDVHVIVLEFVEGRSLKDMLSESPCGLGVDEALRIAFGLIDGLSYTSARGIVHRDIKPANVIVRPDGTPKLIDFEVAHRVEGTATVGGNNMIGTFDYMAPDFTDTEFRGDVRSDIFSMGVCLHELLTGRTPYRRKSATSSQANVAFLQRWLKVGASSNPLKISSRVEKLLPGAREVLECALTPDRAKRIADFPAFRKALGRVRYRELSHAGQTWRLLSYIGHGGFGEVFGAVDCATGRRVAVKHLLNEAGIYRFQREAATMRRVSDAGFPRFIDFFMLEDSGAFLVMDYLDGMPGQSLKEVLHANHHGGLDSGAVLTAFARYARALAGLHAIGVVHRDIKPANLYFPVAAPESAVIMDLGIARDLSGTATVGNVPGTIDYMPPECVTGQTRGGPEADVWALGLCLYEALTGQTAYPRLPDGTAAFQAYLARVQKGVRPDFTGVADRPELRELLEQMCTLDPARRLRDVRLVERRLRIANGEDPANLPVPETQFVWTEDAENKDDGNHLDGDDAESFFDMTQETVWGGVGAELTQETVWADAHALDNALASHPDKKKSKMTFAFLLFVVVLLVAGGVVWKYSEDRKAVAMAEADKQARLATEAQRKAEQEAEARRVAEAQRKAEREAEARRVAEAQQKAEREAEARRVAEAQLKAEREAEARRAVEAQRQLRMAEEQAEDVLSSFRTNAVTVSEADAKVDKWIHDFRDAAAVAAIFVNRTNDFACARAARLARDALEVAAGRLRAAKAEAEKIVALCRGTNETASACSERVESWRAAWREKIAVEEFSQMEKALSSELSQRTNRERRLELAAKAVAAASRVEAVYADSNVPIDRANAAYEAWRRDWREVLDTPSVAAADKRLSAARQCRAKPKPLPSKVKKDDAETERRMKLKRLDDAWTAYKQDYNMRLDEALRPGSRTDPRPLQQEYFQKRNAYKEARKKLEQGK